MTACWLAVLLGGALVAWLAWRQLRRAAVATLPQPAQSEWDGWRRGTKAVGGFSGEGSNVNRTTLTQHLRFLACEFDGASGPAFGGSARL